MQNNEDANEIDKMLAENKHYKQLEKDWKKSQLRQNQKELQETNSVDEKFVLSARKKNLKKQLSKLDDFICDRLYWNRKLEKRKTPQWFIEINQDKIEEMKEKYRKLENKIRWLSSSRRQENSQQSFDIEQIKQIPIKSVLDYYNIEVVNNKILCLKSKENTPSCHIYENTNTFKCFSCGNYGDIISLVELLAETDFISACRILNKM